MEMEMKIMSKEVRKKVLRADGNQGRRREYGSVEMLRDGLVVFIPCKF
jgi:hypothetical protein